MEKTNKGCICEVGVGNWVDGKCSSCNRQLSDRNLEDLGTPDHIQILQVKRNKLNRQIAKLKKEYLNQ